MKGELRPGKNACDTMIARVRRRVIHLAQIMELDRLPRKKEESGTRTLVVYLK